MADLTGIIVKAAGQLSRSNLLIICEVTVWSPDPGLGKEMEAGESIAFI